MTLSIDVAISDSDSSDDGRKKKGKNKKGKEKEKAKKQKHAIPEKHRKGKESRIKDKSNGSLDKRARNEKETKKSKKKPKDKDERSVQKEQEEKFKKLARLADYGDINDLQAEGRGRKTGARDRKVKSKKSRRLSLDRENPSYDYDDVRGQDCGDNIGLRGRDEADMRNSMNRSYDAQSSFDSRDGRGSGRDEEGRTRRSGRDDRGSSRDEEGGVRYRNSGRDVREMKENRKNKKGRKDMEEDNDVRIERTFERLDVYEDKFERERERAVESVRYREEFQDFYRGRDDDIRGGGYMRERDPRDLYRGGRDRVEMMDRYDRAPPMMDDRRRGRDRNDEGIVRRDDRRKRR